MDYQGLLGLTLNRQGGAADRWDTGGTTDYIETGCKILSGSATCTISSGTGSGTANVTFPSAFVNRPICFCTIDDSGAFGTADEQAFVAISNGTPTTTACSFRSTCRSGTVSSDRTFNIHWLAIGN